MSNFMGERTDYQFSYYSLKLWIDSIVTIVIFSSITLLLVWNRFQPYGIILTLIIWRVIWSHFYCTVNNLYRQLTGKPAIQLTEKYFIDHINRKKIDWKNITGMRLTNLKGSTFVCFDLKDLESYVKESRSLMDKFLYKLNLHPEEIFVKTELSLVYGKNEVIFNEINSFLRHKAAHNSG